MLGYRSSSPRYDGKFVKVEVRPLRRHVELITRRGYMAPEVDPQVARLEYEESRVQRNSGVMARLRHAFSFKDNIVAASRRLGSMIHTWGGAIFTK